MFEQIQMVMVFYFVTQSKHGNKKTPANLAMGRSAGGSPASFGFCITRAGRPRSFKYYENHPR
jgi:hypothetical protein